MVKDKGYGRCIYCGSELVYLAVGDDSLAVGCPRCGIYVIVGVGELGISNNNVNSRREFRRIARMLYKKYITYSAKALALRNSVGNVGEAK